jgi:transposase
MAAENHPTDPRDKEFADLRAEVERLRGRIGELEALLREALRAGKRQSSPFSKGDPRPDPNKPGRKAGEKHGRHGHRPPPPDDRVSEIVPVPLAACCPDCGGELENRRVEFQWQEEIPEPKPVVRRFEIEVGDCRGCKRTIESRHPLQTGGARGAAAVTVGPEAKAMAARLHYELGLSYGKTASVMREVHGIDITRGGVARMLASLGDCCEPTYGALVTAVRQSPVVAMDETGWRVGGWRSWLWVATTIGITVYAIRAGRGFAEAAELLGEDYEGILARDGWKPYSGFKKARHQTCLAHLLRRCDEILMTAKGRAREVPKAVTAILLEALDLRDERDAGEIGSEEFNLELGKLEERLRAQIAKPTNTKPTEQGRLLRHLAREFDAMFTFLREPGVPATTWRAEQAIRPAVVNRKVWGGNRTWNGARCQERVMSILRTCRQQAVEPLKMLADLLRAPTPIVAPLPLLLPAPAAPG